MRFFLLFLFSFLFQIPYGTSQIPCAIDSSLHLVVLGSSTAAGAGANPADSAWVNLYRSHLQILNPDYEVTNLARGGYSTYWLMPNDFTPPAGRPSPDTTRNISRAVNLSPDGIIVNLPSNDVSSGYSVAEQLSNFEVIVASAQNANIPIWVCTTQPKNYGSNPIPIQKQLDVRDSIIARYSPFVLDFWSGLADTSNQIAPFYDSGDGTHLNNAGHYLLFNRAKNADLPGQLVNSPDYVDYHILGFAANVAPDCGIANSIYTLTVINRGLDDFENIPIQLIVKNQDSGEEIIYQDTLQGGLLHCEQRDIPFIINSNEAGSYLLTLLIEADQDGDLLNNNWQLPEYFIGVPFLDGMSGTTCFGNGTSLQANVVAGDSVRWYDAQTDGTLLGTGPVFQTPLLYANTSYYAEAIRGDFIEQNSLVANDLFDRDWNGFMFDLQADVDLFLDSLEIKVDTFGEHFVDLYTRQGSHLGYELDPSAWDYLGAFPIQVSSPSEWTAIDLNGIAMQAGDSLAIYMALQNPINTLFYLAVPEPVVRSNDDLTLFSGSGISSNFSELYFPRDWNGRVHYQVIKPNGDCSSGRMKIEAIVSDPEINLGKDTTLRESESLLLEIEEGFSVVKWSDGSSEQNLLVDGAVWGLGIFEFDVIVEDEFSCEAYDTILIEFTPIVNTADISFSTIRVWPNPVANTLYLHYPAGNWNIHIWDQFGRKIFSDFDLCDHSCQQKITVADWVSGIYFLEMTKQSGQVFFKKIVLQ